MLSYTGQRNLYGTLTKNTATANLSTGDSLIAAYTRLYLRKIGTALIETTETHTTTATMASDALPALASKIKSITHVVGTTRYTIKKSPNRKHWDRLTESTATTATPTEWWYPIGDRVYFWPKIADASDTLEYAFSMTWRNNTIADYTTGTITSVANAGTAVVGASTVWHAGMIGRYLKITMADAANSGDEEWYKISAVTDTTHLTLARPYAGASITAATASYLIGQVSPLPSGFHELPVFRAAQVYWAKEDNKRSREFEKLADVLEEELMQSGQNDVEDPTIDDTEEELINPNLTVEL